MLLTIVRAFKSGRCEALFPEPDVLLAIFSARVFSVCKYTQEMLVDQMVITYQSSSSTQVGGSETQRLQEAGKKKQRGIESPVASLSSSFTLHQRFQEDRLYEVKYVT